MPPVSVFLVASSAAFLRGLRGYLDEEPTIHVIATALCGDAALAQVGVLQPQVILVDLRLKWSLGEAEASPNNGWRLVLALGELNPPPSVLVLTDSLEPLWLERLAQAGVRGCLDKEEQPEVIALAVRVAATGKAVWTPAQLALLQDNHIDPLSAREHEVLALLAQGCTNVEISRRLNVNVGTVNKHVEHIFAKLGTHNRTEAVAVARRRGLVEKGI